MSANSLMQKVLRVIKYDCGDYLHMLKELMPMGPIWNWPIFDCSALVAPWVYLNTYIEDGFVGGYDGWWDSAFTNNWSLAVYDGVDVAVRGGSGGQDRLTPTGAGLSGDFDLRCTIKFYSSDTGTDKSIHFIIYEAETTNAVADLYWVGDELRFYAGYHRDIVSVPFSAWGEFDLRLVRTGSTITAYYDTGSGWVAMANPIVGAYTGDYHLEVDGATYHSISKFKLQSDSGFPTTEDFSGFTIWARLLSCFALEFIRIEGKITDLLNEMIPALAVEMLEEWEVMAGLPDECTALGATILERQNTVHEKITVKYQFMNEQFYIDYAAGLGVTITIDTWATLAEARCGIARCGDARCSAVAQVYWWRVNLPTGDPLNSTIECIFNKLKPAESTLVFAYV